MNVRLTSHQSRDIMRWIGNDLESIFNEVLDYVKCNFTPDEVFTGDVLKEWAEDNGYVLKDE
jgi:hypothetical protein